MITNFEHELVFWVDWLHSLISWISKQLMLITESDSQDVWYLDLFVIKGVSKKIKKFIWNIWSWFTGP